MNRSILAREVNRMAQDAIFVLEQKPPVPLAQITRCRNIVQFTEKLPNTAKVNVSLEDWAALTNLPE